MRDKMNDNFFNHDERINNAQENQNVEPTLEELLTRLIINPARLNTVRKNLSNFDGKTLTIAQSREGSLINQAGFPEEINSDEIFLLDDGTSLCGITICQTCGGVVKEENIRRCKCGQTCCLRKGCGRFSRLRNEWYCCSWHKFKGKLGFNLR
jgi:hypothetical protein